MRRRWWSYRDNEMSCDVRNLMRRPHRIRAHDHAVIAVDRTLNSSRIVASFAPESANRETYRETMTVLAA